MYEIISIAIGHEKSSHQYYLNAFKRGTSEATKKVFALLVEQETAHEAYLRTQLEEVKAEIKAERKKLKQARTA
jgi:rubrerythrin